MVQAAGRDDRAIDGTRAALAAGDRDAVRCDGAGTLTEPGTTASVAGQWQPTGLQRPWRIGG
jgi:hypothetical protein